MLDDDPAARRDQSTGNARNEAWRTAVSDMRRMPLERHQLSGESESNRMP